MQFRVKELGLSAYDHKPKPKLGLKNVSFLTKIRLMCMPEHQASL